jgi:hypothetical protein
MQMGTTSRGWLHEKIHEYARVHCADQVHSLLHLLIQRSERSFCLSCLTPLNYHYKITTCHALLFWNSTDEPDHHGLSFAGGLTWAVGWLLPSKRCRLTGRRYACLAHSARAWSTQHVWSCGLGRQCLQHGGETTSF